MSVTMTCFESFSICCPFQSVLAHGYCVYYVTVFSHVTLLDVIQLFKYICAGHYSMTLSDAWLCNFLFVIKGIGIPQLLVSEMHLYESILILDHSRLVCAHSGLRFPDWFGYSTLPVNHTGAQM